MTKEAKLVKKVKGLLKHAKVPRFLHRFGPKKYKFWQHFLALFVKQELNLSYRRVEALLSDFGIKVPTYSALCKCVKRLPLAIFRLLLNATIGLKSIAVAAIDSTGFTRTNPSGHYLQRIDRLKPIKQSVKLSVLADAKSHKILSARIRALPAHDIRDAKYLIGKTQVLPKVLVGDSAYDAESLHKLAFDKGFKTVIKPRRNVRRGFYRRKMQQFYSERIYHKRENVESTFSRLKQLHGGSVRCRTARTQRAEIFCKIIAHNLSIFLDFSDFFNSPHCNDMLKYRLPVLYSVWA
jgi:transposase